MSSLKSVLSIWVVLAAAHVWSASVPPTDATGCPEEYLGRCRCQRQSFENQMKFVTNCTNTQFTDVALLERIPRETQVLIFTGNTFHDLPPNVFGFDDTNLEVIDLSDNRIRVSKSENRTVAILANLEDSSARLAHA
jgi:hypothetical protein